MDRGELLLDLGQPVAEAVGEQEPGGEVQSQGQQAAAAAAAADPQQGLARGGPVSTAGQCVQILF